MARKRTRKRKLCPDGVVSECVYCVELRGDIWKVLDPSGATIEESKSQRKAMGIADNYIISCEASRSGYGQKQKRRDFNHRRGPFRW